MCLFQQIAQAEGKYTAIPQSSLLDIGLGGGKVGFFLKGMYFADRIARFREDIAVFFTWLGGFNDH